jgi:hypothetical protein
MAFDSLLALSIFRQDLANFMSYIPQRYGGHQLMEKAKAGRLEEKCVCERERERERERFGECCFHLGFF